jgi:phospholipid/cholesterol/gamma-HCH transport system permease protein
MAKRGLPSADPKDTHEAVSALEIRPAEDGLLSLHLSGRWLLREPLPPVSRLTEALAHGGPFSRIAIDTKDVTGWDTALPVFLRAVQKIAAQHGVGLDDSGLDQGARMLLHLASAMPPREATEERVRPGFVTQVGEAALRVRKKAADFLGFIGEVALAVAALVRGAAVYRRADFGLVLEETGPQALAIVSLISFLVGLILAFVGAVQLARFGAQIYIADLVGLAMAREMGPIMAGIIMAGRTGAAFAAQLGTMQVNQEIDALKTLGISPVEFLVLPRVLALVLMMPLLTLYADLVGIGGGLVVSVSLFAVTLPQYWHETLAALSLTQFVIGLVKSVVFGAIVAIAGCAAGMRASGSASAVGEAATTAVVSGIVAIIVADGIFAVVLNALKL